MLAAQEVGWGPVRAVSLRASLAAVGYRQTLFYDLQENTYLAVFEPAAAPASPAAIRPCSASRRSR